MEGWVGLKKLCFDSTWGSFADQWVPVVLQLLRAGDVAGCLPACCEALTSIPGATGALLLSQPCSSRQLLTSLERLKSLGDYSVEV